MVISIKFKKVVVLLVIALIICGLSIYLWGLSEKDSAVVRDESLSDNLLDLKIQQIFNIRNKALLEEDENILKSLYNKDVKKGLWAYEHELKRMEYLHNWSDKQGIEFEEIDSEVIVRNVKEKGDEFVVTLLVATKYQYVYEDAPEEYNSFRIGSYHSLDLLPRGKELLITKEWYRDPFADALNLDKIKDQNVKKLIVSREAKDFSDLNEKRINAVKYVDQYCGAANPPQHGYQYNSKYKNYNYQGGDCANFASQMLYEGGGFTKTSTWNYKRGKGSKAWVNAHAFNKYMINSGRASVIARGGYEKVLKPSYKLLPGDYIAYEKSGGVKHISVVTGVDSKGYILVNSHNSDRYRVPWDLGWSNKEVKFWLVRVHY